MLDFNIVLQVLSFVDAVGAARSNCTLFFWPIACQAIASGFIELRKMSARVRCLTEENVDRGQKHQLR